MQLSEIVSRTTATTTMTASRGDQDTAGIARRIMEGKSRGDDISRGNEDFAPTTRKYTTDSERSRSSVSKFCGGFLYLVIRAKISDL